MVFCIWRNRHAKPNLPVREDETPVYTWNQMYLNLCLTCSKDYIYRRNNDIVWKKFITALMKATPNSIGKVEIPLEDKSITFTATHLAEVQEIFKAQGWGRKAPERKPKLGKSIENQTE